jgi:hypothetical protein
MAKEARAQLSPHREPYACVVLLQQSKVNTSAMPSNRRRQFMCGVLRRHSQYSVAAMPPHGIMFSLLDKATQLPYMQKPRSGSIGSVCVTRMALPKTWSGWDTPFIGFMLVDRMIRVSTAFSVFQQLL